MTLAILGIVSALIPIVWFLIKRKLDTKPDPAKRDDKINQAIVQGDSTTVNADLDDVLKRLRANEGSNNPSGQGGG